jgi:hypothetical protein
MLIVKVIFMFFNFTSDFVYTLYDSFRQRCISVTYTHCEVKVLLLGMQLAEMFESLLPS